MLLIINKCIPVLLQSINELLVLALHFSFTYHWPDEQVQFLVATVFIEMCVQFIYVAKIMTMDDGMESRAL